MKKSLLFITIIILTLSSFAQSISRAQLRESFLRATGSKKSLDSLTLQLDLRSQRTPTEECYLGMCEALQISDISGMWSKLKMLDRSRGHVGHAVAAAPQDAELRFLRFMLEHNIPSFLGMSGHMTDDLAYVLAHPTFMDDNTELKKITLEYMLSSKRCTKAQTAMLQQHLSDLTRKQYAER